MLLHNNWQPRFVVNGCTTAPFSKAKQTGLKRLQMSQRKTFKHWKVTAENKQATTICETIIDNLGERHNPHIILGEREVGKSHLLHATGRVPCAILMGMFVFYERLNYLEKILYHTIGMKGLPPVRCCFWTISI